MKLFIYVTLFGNRNQRGRDLSLVSIRKKYGESAYYLLSVTPVPCPALFILLLGAHLGKMNKKTNKKLIWHLTTYSILGILRYNWVFFFLHARNFLLAMLAPLHYRGNHLKLYLFYYLKLFFLIFSLPYLFNMVSLNF